MTEDESVALVGGTLAHVTPEGNVAVIRQLRLLRPLTPAGLAGVDPAALVLRRDAVRLDLPEGRAVLNHQRPLRAGTRGDVLDGSTLEEWAAQRDGRVFLWPGRRGGRFAAGAAALALDARGLFRAMRDVIDLAPINTGSATRRPARRGPGTHVPATAGAGAFRAARGRRDRVAEVSLRADLPPGLLARIVTGWPSA